MYVLHLMKKDGVAGRIDNDGNIIVELEGVETINLEELMESEALAGIDEPIREALLMDLSIKATAYAVAKMFKPGMPPLKKKGKPLAPKY